MYGNWWILFIAALVPMIVGFVWYGPLLGKAWMKVNNFTEESLKGANMALIMGLSYFLSVILASGIMAFTNHQLGIDQLIGSHPEAKVIGSETEVLYTSISEKYKDRHRNFGHGAFHGVLGAILVALPLIAINALFERRGWKYIGIHFGYWLITIALMGGIVCQWL